jgi:hypothetical protein
MEYMVMAVVGFVATVSAYLMGVSHGMRVSNRNIPHPIKEATQSIKQQITPQVVDDDITSQLLSYDYNKALESVKKEHLEGRR